MVLRLCQLEALLVTFPGNADKTTYIKSKNIARTSTEPRKSASSSQKYLPSSSNNNSRGALITWNDSYSVGVIEMDNQHKQLVTILNELYSAMQSQKSADIVGKVLKNLISYTEKHFSDEEEFMKRHSYPGIGSQTKEHKAFIDKIQSFKKDYDAGRTSMSVSITSFLKDWLVNHISISDKKYGEYVNGTNKSEAELLIPLNDF